MKFFVNIEEQIDANLKLRGYTELTSIQKAIIEKEITGRDAIVSAQTGSGKTIAFGLSIVSNIPNNNKVKKPPSVLIIAPTRELALQVQNELDWLYSKTSICIVSCVGGMDMRTEKRNLRKFPDIVLGTPGRLKDYLERELINLSKIKVVVLDEADRMIDLGFEPQVMGVLDAMPSSNLKPENEDEMLEENKVYRTTYMFSATMPPAVERLARKYLRRPVIVTIGRAGKATDNITQRVLVMKENEKQNALEQELYDIGDAKVIVFANTHRKCEAVTKQVEASGFFATMLHGGKSQEQREESIRGFRQGKYNILVATDVAGRGIDVPDVMLVINYDMPHTIEAYTHRIGRTGRAGRKGDACLLYTSPSPRDQRGSRMPGWA